MDPTRERDREPKAPGAQGEGREGGMDPTRKLLKVFGVKVTDYETKTDELVARYGTARTDGERAAVRGEALELTADLDHWLREVQTHVLGRQEAVLRKLGGE